MAAPHPVSGLQHVAHIHIGRLGAPKSACPGQEVLHHLLIAIVVARADDHALRGGEPLVDTLVHFGDYSGHSSALLALQAHRRCVAKELHAKRSRLGFQHRSAVHPVDHDRLGCRVVHPLDQTLGFQIEQHPVHVRPRALKPHVHELAIGNVAASLHPLGGVVHGVHALWQADIFLVLGVPHGALRCEARRCLRFAQHYGAQAGLARRQSGAQARHAHAHDDDLPLYRLGNLALIDRPRNRFPGKAAHGACGICGHSTQLLLAGRGTTRQRAA